MTKLNSNSDSSSIWIIGASDGIGKALVELLYLENHSVIISSRNHEALTKIKDACYTKKENTASQTIIVEPLDISDCNSLNTITDNLAEQVDTVIICAGISQRTYAFDMDEQSEQYINKVNFIAPTVIMKHLIKQWKNSSNTKKRIVLVSSIAGHVPVPLRAMYGASKTALEHYCETMHNELRQAKIKNISLNIIIPGFVNTNISKRALTQDMKPWRQSDQNQKKGISPQKAAKQIRAVLSSKKQFNKKFIGMNFSLNVLLSLYSIMPKVTNYILSRINTAK